MRALELNSIMLTRISWTTINLLIHRHAITRTWAVMYPCTFKFNVWYLNTCDHPIEIYISAFHLRHLCIPTRLVKATYNIKTSLIKQWYTWYAWNWGYWYCWYWYCWYWYADTAGVYMLYTTCSMLCAWPVYISLLYHAKNHVITKSCSLKTKQVQHFIKYFEIIQNIVSS